MNKRVNTASWDAKNKRWRVTAQRDGVRKQFYSMTPGRKGQREANEKADRWLSGAVQNENVSVDSAYEQWIEELKLTTSQSSWRQYDAFGRNYILPAIGKKRVSAITNEQILQNIILNAYKNGNGGKGLAKKTLTNLRGCLVAFMKYCRKRGLTDLRPENLTVPRAAKTTEKRILQPCEVKILFLETETGPSQKYGAPHDEWYINAYRFQAAIGLRPGEVLGLQWDDISADGLLSIKRAINDLDEITDGKNENALRDFRLPALAMDALNRQREQTADLHSKWVFCDTNGDFTHQRPYYKHLKKYCRYHGITPVTAYELRHTWYSLMKTLPVELVKRIGGHSESMDTFGVYGHDVDGELQNAAKMMDSVFSSILRDDSQ